MAGGYMRPKGQQVKSVEIDLDLIQIPCQNQSWPIRLLTPELLSMVSQRILEILLQEY